MLSELASRLPDQPRWVETRGVLLSGRCELVGPVGPGPADFVVRGTDFGLFCVAGQPAMSPLAAALEREGGEAVLCAPEAAPSVAPVLRGWKASRAVIHSLAGQQIAPGGTPSEARVSMLGRNDADALGHVPGPLRRELATALGFSHVAAAFADDRPVSFCYASYETESLWDVSIDTLEAYRGRHLARACCEFLIAHMARHGKEPVWGVLEQNVASRKLAESLGFEPVDALAVFQPAGAP